MGLEANIKGFTKKQLQELVLSFEKEAKDLGKRLVFMTDHCQVLKWRGRKAEELVEAAKELLPLEHNILQVSGHTSNRRTLNVRWQRFKGLLEEYGNDAERSQPVE